MRDTNWREDWRKTYLKESDFSDIDIISLVTLQFQIRIHCDRLQCIVKFNRQSNHENFKKSNNPHYTNFKRMHTPFWISTIPHSLTSLHERSANHATYACQILHHIVIAGHWCIRQYCSFFVIKMTYRQFESPLNPSKSHIRQFREIFPTFEIIPVAGLAAPISARCFRKADGRHWNIVVDVIAGFLRAWGCFEDVDQESIFGKSVIYGLGRSRRDDEQGWDKYGK